MGQCLSSRIQKWCNCFLVEPSHEPSSDPNILEFRARSSSLDQGPMVQYEPKDLRQTRRGLAWIPNHLSMDSSSDGHGLEVKEGVESVMGEGVIFKYFYRSNQSIDMEKGIMLVKA
ncbi:uncharacterized protein LOC131882365 [Tigriopus californicus]|uniref:uncharacterized protein LOC131882365 n=1 Tax=Tigriopus californicus TaxID=6832 RepID=UPI0027DA3D92|nr:uncharacterized protein LOC131882365 [Tigriopus californicus]